MPITHTHKSGAFLKVACEDYACIPKELLNKMFVGDFERLTGVCMGWECKICDYTDEKYPEVGCDALQMMTEFLMCWEGD